MSRDATSPALVGLGFGEVSLFFRFFSLVCGGLRRVQTPPRQQRTERLLPLNGLTNANNGARQVILGQKFHHATVGAPFHSSRLCAGSSGNGACLSPNCNIS